MNGNPSRTDQAGTGEWTFDIVESRRRHARVTAEGPSMTEAFLAAFDKAGDDGLWHDAPDISTSARNVCEGEGNPRNLHRRSVIPVPDLLTDNVVPSFTGPGDRPRDYPAPLPDRDRLQARYDAGERDFSEEDFSGQDLLRLRTPHALFYRANFSGARLQAADLQGSAFREAAMDGAILSCADLSETGFHGARLVLAHLDRARLWNARFEAADLTGADLRGVIASQADFRAACMKRVLMSRAHLPRASFEAADLEEASLAWSNLFEARLARVTAHRADLTGAVLDHASLNYGDFTDASLNGANMPHASCRKTNLTRANLRGAKLVATDFHGAILEGIEASEAWLASLASKTGPQGMASAPYTASGADPAPF